MNVSHDKSSCPQCGKLLAPVSNEPARCSSCQWAETPDSVSQTEWEEATLAESTFAGPPLGAANASTADPLETRAQGDSLDAAKSEPGFIDFGSYELLGEIARGGMGVVYKARQKNANRLVALKMILGRRLSSSQAIQRFRAEAEAAAGLDHPGIVPVFDVGQIDGQHFFTMGFIEGQSLKEHVWEGPLPPLEAARVTQMLAEAVAYAHGKGVVHRDIKPSNILMRPDDESPTGNSAEEATSNRSTSNTRPMITDFGLAKHMEGGTDLTMSGQIVGTPQYMAPEQALGDVANIGAPADVYGVGATLYHLLTGRPPFHSASVADTLTQVIQNEPTPPRQLNSTIDRDLETICLKCLSKDQAKRYASAQEVAAELQRFRNGEPIIARPVSATERTIRWCKRYPAFAALLGTVALTLLVGTGVSTWFAIVAHDRALAADEAKDLANEQSLEAIKRKLEVEEQRKVLRQQLYVNRIDRARRLWEEGESDAAWSTLYSCPADLRGWEHDYLSTLFAKARRTLSGTFDPVECVAFGPDGWFIAGGDAGGSIILWDAETGEVADSLLGHYQTVACLAWGNDSSQLASASTDGMVIIWNLDTLQPRFEIEAHEGYVLDIAYDFEGERIATVGDNHIGVWNAETGELIVRLTSADEQSFPSSVCFLPGGKQLATGDADHTLKIWSIETGKVTQTLAGHRAEIAQVAIRSDGREIATAGGDGDIRLWDVETGECTRVFANAHVGGVFSLAYSPDGIQLASGGYDRLVKVWSLYTDAEVLTLKGHSQYVRSVSFNRAGNLVVSGAGDAKIWNVDYGVRGAFVADSHLPGLRQFAVHPRQADRLLCVGESIAETNANTRELLRSIDLQEDVVAAAYSPDGSKFVTGSISGKVQIWNAATGAELASCEGALIDIFGVAFGADGDAVYAGDNEGFVCKWSVAAGELLLTISRKGEVACKSLAVNPGGGQIATGDNDGVVSIWDANTGDLLKRFEGLGELPQSVAFSPGGDRIVGGGQSGTLKLWDMKSGEELHTMRRRMEGFHTVLFTPDGDRIVSGGSNNVVLWDVKSGLPTMEMPGDDFTSFHSLAISADGAVIYSGSTDGYISMWSTEKSGQDDAVAQAIANRCATNQTAIADENIEVSKSIGGKGGDLAFEAIGDDGSFLVGVRRHYVVFSNSNAISGLDLLFQNADGSVSSKFVGVPGEKIYSNLAPPGYYATGAFVGHTRWLHNLELHFGPIVADDSAEPYTQGWFPAAFDMERVDLDFESRNIIGVRGRHGYVIDSIQFITAGQEQETKVQK